MHFNFDYLIFVNFKILQKVTKKNLDDCGCSWARWTTQSTQTFWNHNQQISLDLFKPLKFCREIQQHANTNKELFHKVRLLARKFKRKSLSIRDVEVNIQTDLEVIVSQTAHVNHSVHFLSVMTTTSSRRYWHRNLRIRTWPSCFWGWTPSKKINDQQSSRIWLRYHWCLNIFPQVDWHYCNGWRKTKIIPLHKKWSTKICNNYRLLALIFHASEEKRERDQILSEIL